MNGFICICGWVGTEPNVRRELDKVDERMTFYTCFDTCPVCASEELTEINLCVYCQDCGVDVPAIHDDMCFEHAQENDWDFDTTEAGQFRRDRSVA